MNHIHAIVLGTSFTVCITLVVFILSKYNYLVNKARIENGVAGTTTGSRYRYLEYGCMLVGLGAGLGVSSVFTFMPLSEDAMDLLVWATILIFGGSGLLLAYYIRRKQESDSGAVR